MQAEYNDDRFVSRCWEESQRTESVPETGQLNKRINERTNERTNKHEKARTFRVFTPGVPFAAHFLYAVRDHFVGRQVHQVQSATNTGNIISYT